VHRAVRRRTGAPAYPPPIGGAAAGARSVRVRVRPGQRLRFTVATTRAPRCARALKAVVPFYAPTAPANVAAAQLSETAVRLSWTAAQPDDGRLAGYRVTRDGATYGQVAGTTMDVAVPAGAASTLTVAAVDTRGNLSPASAPVTVSTTSQAPGAPTTGSAHAYLLATTDQSFEDFQAHYRSIGVVHPTYFQCNRATSAIEGSDDPLVTQWAQARRVKVLARFDCQSASAIDRILNDPATRQQTLDGLAGLAARYRYDGTSLDLEYGAASNRDAVTRFVADLAGRLHAAGRQLSMAVSPKSADNPTHPRSGIFDYPALAASADWIFVMNWGIHWATSVPGPLADLPWATANADYIATMPQKKKLVLGAPLYGFDWAGNGGSAQPGTPLENADVRALIARVGATPRWDADAGEWTFTHRAADGQTHTVWYLDSRAVGLRFALARDRGLGGVGVWHLGTEDQAVLNQPLVAPGIAW
jgi:spore germination protein